MSISIINDPCLECGKATLGVFTASDGTTIGVGMNRLSYDDGDRDGWLCGDCAGFECDECGENIYIDEDITVETENYGNLRFHDECFKTRGLKDGERIQGE